MTETKDLVAALRYCGSPVTNEYDCNNCPWLKECKEGTGTNPLLKAADLIESLLAESADLVEQVKCSQEEIRKLDKELVTLRNQLSKHGEWVLPKDFPGYAMCSCCEDAFIDPDWIAKDKKWNYCPNCGARMGGVQDALS